MRIDELFESFGRTTLPLQPTDEMIARAKDFCLRKWVERFHENELLARDHPELAPKDLTNSCKFTSQFAQAIFGGVLRGNYDHQYLVCHGKKIDLNFDAGDVQRLGSKAHRHDGKFFGSESHQASMDSCVPRVNRWIEEFINEL